MFHAEITISVCNLADYIMYTAHMFVDEIPSVLPEKNDFWYSRSYYVYTWIPIFHMFNGEIQHFTIFKSPSMNQPLIPVNPCA